MVQLNQRQLDVLRWIGDGCPDRDWPDQSHKLTARSLAGQGSGGRQAQEEDLDGHDHGCWPVLPRARQTAAQPGARLRTGG